MFDLGPAQLGVALVAVTCFGLSKTALPSSGALGGALLASVIPARESAGVALPLLIVADLVALVLYARHVLLPLLVGLMPALALGLGVGFLLVRYASSALVARLIGVMLLAAALGEAWRRRPVRDRAAARADAAPEGGPDAGPDAGPNAAGEAADEHRGVRARLVTWLAGTVAGASTMVANAGGPPMTLYLLRMNVSVLGFMGTFTVFFFILNVLKVPLSLGLGLITAESLRLDLVLLPAVLAGTLLGTFLLPRLRRDTFEWIAIVSTALASVWLIATA